MNSRRFHLVCAATLLGCLAGGVHAHAAEHVTLRNGFEVDCARREAAGDNVRLYLLEPAGSAPSETANYIEVPATSIVRSEQMPDPPAPVAAPAISTKAPTAAPLTREEMNQMLASAGATHNVDADLLAAVVHAESNGQVHAVSRAGAEGLMQLMPATAADLGVSDAFAPADNIRGGTAYLDQLLTRYHDNLALALAAYNAGPAAVDKYHGVPPYAETRAYVARVIREFNRRKRVGASDLQATATRHD